MSKNELSKKLKYLLRFLPDKMYCQFYHFSKFKKFINFKNPKTFNEKINWLKLYDRNPIYTIMADKYEVKRYVANIIGEDHIIPTIGIYDKFDEIDFDKLPNKFVIKCTHDSGSLCVVTDKSKFDKEKAKEKIENAMKYNFYYIGREWQYKNIKPRIIVEEYICSDKNRSLNDYKFQMMNGKLAFSYVCTDRDIGDLKCTHYDANKKFVDMYQKGYDSDRKKGKLPKNYDEMLNYAKILSKDFPIMRVDFLGEKDKIYFGELTLYENAGFAEFFPLDLDKRFGEMLDISSVKKMKKINVLNVITGGLFCDGITLSQIDYLKNLDKDKLSVDVACVTKSDKKIIKSIKSIDCNVIMFPDRKRHFIKYIIELSKQIKNNGYDIIHVHGSSSFMLIELLIAKMHHVPVRIAHSRNTKTDHPIMDKLLRPIFNRSYNVALACGNDAGKFLFNRKNFIIFHNGKDLKKYAFDEKIRKQVRKKYNIENKVAICNIGNFNYQKNHMFLIDIFNQYHKKNKNSILFLIGDGSKRKEIVERLKELKLTDSVILLGRIDNTHEIMNGMDIALLPSLFEGLPNVVLEWQAAGLPVILSNTITEECCVTDNVTYLPIEKSDINKWVKKIDEMLNKNENRENMSNIGCQKLKDNGFEIINNTKKLEELYIKYISLYKRK